MAADQKVSTITFKSLLETVPQEEVKASDRTRWVAYTSQHFVHRRDDKNDQFLRTKCLDVIPFCTPEKWVTEYRKILYLIDSQRHAEKIEHLPMQKLRPANVIALCREMLTAPECGRMALALAYQALQWWSTHGTSSSSSMEQEMLDAGLQLVRSYTQLVLESPLFEDEAEKRNTASWHYYTSRFLDTHCLKWTSPVSPPCLGGAGALAMMTMVTMPKELIRRYALPPPSASAVSASSASAASSNASSSLPANLDVNENALAKKILKHCPTVHDRWVELTNDALRMVLIFMIGGTQYKREATSIEHKNADVKTTSALLALPTTDCWNELYMNTKHVGVAKHFLLSFFGNQARLIEWQHLAVDAVAKCQDKNSKAACDISNFALTFGSVSFGGSFLDTNELVAYRYPATHVLHPLPLTDAAARQSFVQIWKLVWGKDEPFPDGPCFVRSFENWPYKLSIDPCLVDDRKTRLSALPVSQHALVPKNDGFEMAFRFSPVHILNQTQHDARDAAIQELGTIRAEMGKAMTKAGGALSVRSRLETLVDETDDEQEESDSDSSDAEAEKKAAEAEDDTPMVVEELDDPNDDDDADDDNSGKKKTKRKRRTKKEMEEAKLSGGGAVPKQKGRPGRKKKEVTKEEDGKDGKDGDAAGGGDDTEEKKAVTKRKYNRKIVTDDIVLVNAATAHAHLLGCTDSRTLFALNDLPVVQHFPYPSKPVSEKAKVVLKITQSVVDQLKESGAFLPDFVSSDAKDGSVSILDTYNATLDANFNSLQPNAHQLMVQVNDRNPLSLATSHPGCADMYAQWFYGSKYTAESHGRHSTQIAYVVGEKEPRRLSVPVSIFGLPAKPILHPRSLFLTLLSNHNLNVPAALARSPTTIMAGLLHADDAPTVNARVDMACSAQLFTPNARINGHAGLLSNPACVVPLVVRLLQLQAFTSHSFSTTQLQLLHYVSVYWQNVGAGPVQQRLALHVRMFLEHFNEPGRGPARRLSTTTAAEWSGKSGAYARLIEFVVNRSHALPNIPTRSIDELAVQTAKGSAKEKKWVAFVADANTWSSTGTSSSSSSASSSSSSSSSSSDATTITFVDTVGRLGDPATGYNLVPEMPSGMITPMPYLCPNDTVNPVPPYERLLAVAPSAVPGSLMDTFTTTMSILRTMMHPFLFPRLSIPVPDPKRLVDCAKLGYDSLRTYWSHVNSVVTGSSSLDDEDGVLAVLRMLWPKADHDSPHRIYYTFLHHAYLCGIPVSAFPAELNWYNTKDNKDAHERWTLVSERMQHPSNAPSFSESSSEMSPNKFKKGQVLPSYADSVKAVLLQAFSTVGARRQTMEFVRRAIEVVRRLPTSASGQANCPAQEHEELSARVHAENKAREDHHTALIDAADAAYRDAHAAYAADPQNVDKQKAGFEACARAQRVRACPPPGQAFLNDFAHDKRLVVTPTRKARLLLEMLVLYTALLEHTPQTDAELKTSTKLYAPAMNPMHTIVDVYHDIETSVLCAASRVLPPSPLHKTSGTKALSNGLETALAVSMPLFNVLVNRSMLSCVSHLYLSPDLPETERLTTGTECEPDGTLTGWMMQHGLSGINDVQAYLGWMMGAYPVVAQRSVSNNAASSSLDLPATPHTIATFLYASPTLYATKGAKSPTQRVVSQQSLTNVPFNPLWTVTQLKQYLSEKYLGWSIADPLWVLVRESEYSRIAMNEPDQPMKNELPNQSVLRLVRMTRSMYLDQPVYVNVRTVGTQLALTKGETVECKFIDTLMKIRTQCVAASAPVASSSSSSAASSSSTSSAVASSATSSASSVVDASAAASSDTKSDAKLDNKSDNKSDEKTTLYPANGVATATAAAAATAAVPDVEAAKAIVELSKVGAAEAQVSKTGETETETVDLPLKRQKLETGGAAVTSTTTTHENVEAGGVADADSNKRKLLVAAT